MLAVRVPPSAWMTSQSIWMVRSPSASRLVTARRLRPIRRWISCVRPDCLPRAASRSERVLVDRGSMPYSALNPDLRSVNHRYLDIQFRIPDELRPLEPGLREKATSRITRGKVEVRIAVAKSADSQSNLQIDDALLGQLAQLNARVKTV